MPQNNIGFKKYNFLIQIDTLTGRPTGERKANSPSDRDYIEPVWDELSCPLPVPTTTTTTTTSTTTTTTTTSTTTTTTTTTIKEPVYGKNDFKCQNLTNSILAFKLFSSIAVEDLLEFTNVNPNSLQSVTYARNINNSTIFSIDVIPSEPILSKVTIKILVNNLIVCDLTLDELQDFHYSLGEFISEPIEIIVTRIPEKIYSNKEYSDLYG